MKKTIISLVLLAIIAMTTTSLEAGVRTRSAVGFQFGTTVTRPCPQRIVRRTPVYVAPRPVPIVVQEPVYIQDSGYHETVIIQEVPCYTRETIVYPAPCRRSFSSFSFGFNFFN